MIANPDHEQRASYAVAVWNRWRDDHPEIAPDLSGAEFNKANLSGADLRGAMLERRQLKTAKFDAKTRLPAELRWMTPQSKTAPRKKRSTRTAAKAGTKPRAKKRTTRKTAPKGTRP